MAAIFIIIILTLLFSGCGIQMPVTEGLVFSSSDPYGRKHEEILPFVRYGGAVTAISAMPVHTSLENAAVDDYGNEQADQLDSRYMRVIANPGFWASFGEGRQLAVAFTPGFIVNGMHVDATVRTVRKIFFTFNHHFALESGTELILQRPILERSGGGLSVGAFFRSQPMQFEEKDDLAGSEVPTFRVQWYGLRLMGQTPDRPNTLQIRGFVNAGYAGKYDAPLVSMGVAIIFE